MPIDKQGLLISIFGPDGAGKSTQATLLSNYLKTRGFKVKVAWVKSYHTLAYVLSNLIAKLSLNTVELNAQGNIIKIKPLQDKRISRKLWTWIEFLSVLPVAIIKVWIPVKAGWIVIADRYLLDSIASIAYTINDPTFPDSLIARLMLGLVPKRAVLIHLDAPYSEIAKRRGKATDPASYIEFLRATCLKLARCLNTISLDTSKLTIDEVQQVIRSAVNKALNKFQATP